ncbi:MAG TPA: hypothetical protein VFR79_03310 [Nitrospira sp.]|nr:hypothetical protein [Nitrospira sp.]
MKHVHVIALVLVVLAVGAVGCRSPHHSAFAEQAIRPNQLVKLNYKTLKTGAIGESTGFKFLWIPFASPSEADAKRDMLERLQKEGINTSGKNIAFANATSDRGGFGFIGLIGAPTITLTADVIEILGEASPAPLVSPQN